MSNRGAQVTAIGYCDGLFMLQQALAPVREITVAGLSAGIARARHLATSRPASSARASGRTTTTASTRTATCAFTSDCNCFHYTSGTKPFP